MRKIYNIEYSNGLYLDLYLPEDNGFKTIVYFHGGGLCSGDKCDERYEEMAFTFTNNGYAFISVNYSLYPNTKFPKYIEECAQSIKFIFNNIKKYGGNEDIFVSGQSAGAWLTLMLCCNKEYLLNVGIDPGFIKGWISDSAQTTSHFNVISYEDGLSELAQRIDEKAPIYFLSPNFVSSPILLIYYENDMPNRSQQNELFYSAVRNFNPNVNIIRVCLPGGHCHGSCEKNADGTYDYVNVTLNWLKNFK